MTDTPSSSYDWSDLDGAVDGEPWPTPEPLTDGRPALRPFPLDTLPDNARIFAESVAANKQVPTDLPAILALGAASTLAGARFVVQRGTNWKEPLNLYAVVGMPPGSRKTPTKEDVMEPLYLIEDKIQRDWRQDAANAAGQTNDGKGTEQTQVETEPELFADDVTVESLGVTMANNKGTISIVETEGGLFGTLAGRYSKGAGANLNLVLKAYNGERWSDSRVTRAGGRIRRPILTLVMAVQPEILFEAANNKAFMDSGFLDRFLFTIPENLIGRRQTHTPPINADAHREWTQTMRTLGDISWVNRGRDPGILELSEDATKMHLLFQEWIEKKMHPETGDYAAMAGWGSKHAGRVLRIAGLLHLIRWCGPATLDRGRPQILRPIDLRTMDDAIRIGKWAIRQAEDVFERRDNPYEAEMTEGARKALSWLRRNIEKHHEWYEVGFPLRAAVMGMKRQAWLRGGGGVERLRAAMRLLVDLGWLRATTIGDAEGYLAHPSLLVIGDGETPPNTQGELL